MKTSGRKTSQTLFLGLVILIMSASLFAAASIYDFTLPSIDGKPAPLANYKGKVVLLVNVASRCGFRRSTRRWNPPTRNTRIKDL